MAVALARRVLAEDDARLANWEGVAGRGLLVLLGASALLPWVDGAVYLGRDAAAPSLLLPCALAPDVAASLLERAFVVHAHAGSEVGGAARVQVSRPHGRRAARVACHASGLAGHGDVGGHAVSTLPHALRPWASILAKFPLEVALNLGPLVARLSVALGPLRAPSERRAVSLKGMTACREEAPSTGCW